MQLVFSDGIESPMFEVEGAVDEEVKTIDIDTARVIRYISMHIYSDNSMDAIRLLDEDLKVIAEINTEAESGEWTENQTIPEGKHIIGLKTNTKSTEIHSLAFILTDISS